MALSLCGKRMLLFRTSIITQTRNQHGYIVLVPEIGEDLPAKNPLNRTDGLPEFNNITIENCRAAIAKQTLYFEAGIKKVEETLVQKADEPEKDIFENVFQPLEELGAPLDATWGLSKTLYLGNSTLMPTTTYIAIHDRAKRARASKFSNLTIYQAAKTALASNVYKNNNEYSRILEKFVLEGRMNGLELTEKTRIHLAEILNKLNVEKAAFREKTEISTKQFQHVIRDHQVVRDFPADLLKLMVADPNQPLKGPWKVTLQSHLYLPIMSHCPDREIRWNMWQAQVARGSGYRSRELATSLNLEEIRFNRQDMAKLLGFETYADLSMQTKMAVSVTNVKKILKILLEGAKPAQDDEVKSLYAFATERGFKYDRLELWDIPYWRTKQQKTVLNYHEDYLKEYFPLNKVLEGLFTLCERLFGIVIKQRSDATTWHKDVKFYDIFESHSSAPVAGFYLDPYMRSQDKVRIENSGSMIGMRNRSRATNVTPLAALVFHFEPPSTTKPSHLSFKEVRSLFHKFGHAMQHLLTRTEYSEVAGLSNVEWDAVEVSGHLLAHWLYNKDVINSITSHCDSEDKMPPQMFQSLVEVHKHMAGYDLCRELYLSALDLELHTTKEFWLDIIKRMFPMYISFPLAKIDSHPCAFTQIFSDEWGTAYYSHLWSRMIAADVYGAFQDAQSDEKQIVNVGKRYRDTFLALGGSLHSSQIFRKFRGRDPSPRALLASLGLKTTSE